MRGHNISLCQSVIHYKTLIVNDIFIYSDLKKKDGYKQSIILSRYNEFVTGEPVMKIVIFAVIINAKEIAMSEQEMKSYRFGRGQEPTDEMLEQVMKEVAQEARESSKKAADAHFEQMRRNIAAHKGQWSERINSIING